jgi:UDP-glucose 4-epimerase
VANRLEANVLITGGLGFIGSHIADALSDQTKGKVVVYDIRARDQKSENVVTVHGDVFDSGGLLRVMRDQEVDSVIHMVGLASIPDCKENPEDSFRLNVSSVHRILEAMRLCDVKRLVFPSTAAVYGATNGPKVDEKVAPSPTTVYGCHKLAAELLIRGYAENYGFNPTILRIFNVYGDLNKEQGVISQFLRSSLAGKPIVVMGGDQLRDFVFLNDVVEAFIKSLNDVASYRKTINIGSGVGVSIKEIAEMIRQKFPKVKILYKPACRGEYSIYADVSQMKNLLGCVPTHPKVGIPRFIKKCWRIKPLTAGSLS